MAIADPPAMMQDVPSFHTTETDRRTWYGTPDTPPRRPLLDRPSDPHPILNMLMDEALLRIMLTSDGAVMALRERVTGAYADTREPVSSLAALIDNLGGRFLQCKTHRKRLEVIKEAQMTVHALRYAPKRSLVRGTPEWRQAIAADPRSCRALESVYGVGYRTIARIKKDARRGL